MGVRNLRDCFFVDIHQPEGSHGGRGQRTRAPPRRGAARRADGVGAAHALLRRRRRASCARARVRTSMRTLTRVALVRCSCACARDARIPALPRPGPGPRAPSGNALAVRDPARGIVPSWIGGWGGSREEGCQGGKAKGVKREERGRACDRTGTPGGIGARAARSPPAASPPKKNKIKTRPPAVPVCVYRPRTLPWAPGAVFDPRLSDSNGRAVAANQRASDHDRRATTSPGHDIARRGPAPALARRPLERRPASLLPRSRFAGRPRRRAAPQSGPPGSRAGQAK